MEKIPAINTEFFFRDMQLQNIYKQVKKEEQSLEQNDFQIEEESMDTFYVPSFQVLKEPVTVPSSFYTGCEKAFASRLEKLEELGFEPIYSDDGHTLLFHAEKGGLCSLDRTTCSVCAVFYDSLTSSVWRANGISIVKHIIAGKDKNVTYDENFSYLDLPLVSKLDEMRLPKALTVENFFGNISREQVAQFEQTGYVLDVDCRWVQPLIANSTTSRLEAREALMNHKMASFPENVQNYFHYPLEKDAVFIKA